MAVVPSTALQAVISASVPLLRSPLLLVQVGELLPESQSVPLQVEVDELLPESHAPKSTIVITTKTIALHTHTVFLMEYV